MDGYPFAVRLPHPLLVFSRTSGPLWVGLSRGLPLLRPCPTQSLPSSLWLREYFLPSVPQLSVRISWNFFFCFTPPPLLFAFSSLLPPSQVFFFSCFVSPFSSVLEVEELLEVVVCLICISFEAVVFVCIDPCDWIGGFINTGMVINYLKGRKSFFKKKKKNRKHFRM